MKKNPTSLATLHTKQETYSHDNYIHKYREVQSNYNKKFEFNLILDLNAECEVAKTVSWGKLFHNGMTLGKKRGLIAGEGGLYLRHLSLVLKDQSTVHFPPKPLTLSDLQVLS